MAAVGNILKYAGSKTMMAPKLVPLLEGIPHKHYSEPFVGSAAMLLAKEPAPLETANDGWGVVINLYRCVQADHARVESTLRERFGFNHEQVFKEAQDMISGRLECDDFTKAAAFVFLGKMSFLGQMGTYTSMPHAGNAINQFDRIMERGVPKAYAERLRRVAFSCVDWRVFLNRLRHSGRDTLVYLDPPYPGTGKIGFEHHSSGLPAFDDHAFADLLETLSEAQYNWVLSSQHHPHLADMVARHGWHVKVFDMPSGGTATAQEAVKVQEVVTYPQGVAEAMEAGQHALL